jgi:DNA-binding transcriptional ArsR family regulator
MSFVTNDEAGHQPAPEPGSPELPLRLTDPRKLRALAHPARIAILQHLALDGPATATECADVAGLSPSACSYHLRALARQGFVEEDLASAVDGRQRPWRALITSVSFGDPSQPSAVQAAGRLLAESFQARFEDIRATYLDREAEYGDEWRAASGMRQDVLHVTASELAAVRSQLMDVLADYRRIDKTTRTPGARRVNATFDLIPWFDPADQA